MKRLLLFGAALACFGLPQHKAQAQTTGCGGINFTPTAGVACLFEPTSQTYSASVVGLAPASSATDIACLNGSASKVVRVQYIAVSGSANAIINSPIIITKHASLDTGGTLATGNALPVAYAQDPNNTAATATLSAWTANPTINDSAPGFIDSNQYSFTATSGGNSLGSPARFDYQERNFSQAPILRTAAQQVCVNLQASTLTTGVVNVTFRWTELAQ